MVGLIHDGMPNLATYLYDQMDDEYEIYTLRLLQQFVKGIRIRTIKKKLMDKIKIIQASFRGHIVRKRIIASRSYLNKVYSARLIQKVFRGFIVRKKIIEYIHDLIKR